ncbi:hypothetical protein EDB84DRAFT_1271286, partial [Lactarius hengduanensis]
HLTIYRPQLTWLACTTKHITALYYFLSLAHLVAPSTLTSANDIEYAAASGLSEWVEITAPFPFRAKLLRV